MNEEVTLSDVLNRVIARMPAHLSMHSSSCCTRARSWFITMACCTGAQDDYSSLSWIHSQWEWGPSKWPMYWCEILEREKLDCGVLADLADLALQEKGKKTIRIQLIEEYDIYVCQNWRQVFSGAGCCVDWIHGCMVYHEVTGYIVGEDLKIWDPSDNNLVIFQNNAPKQHGRVVAIRLAPSELVPSESIILWCGLQLSVGSWQNCEPFYRIHRGDCSD